MSDTDSPHKLDRPGVFAALKRLGANRAVVEFSGGNDEGGPDSITLYVGEEEVSTLSAWPTGTRTVEEQAQDRLADALSEPVFDEYHTFDGDFDVTGEVIWDVAEGTVQMIRDERSDYEHSERLL
jgi:hypothetical protein